MMLQSVFFNNEFFYFLNNQIDSKIPNTIFLKKTLITRRILCTKFKIFYLNSPSLESEMGILI